MASELPNPPSRCGRRRDYCDRGNHRKTFAQHRHSSRKSNVNGLSFSAFFLTILMTYFDWNATTPLSPTARTAWLEANETSWQNSSSLYRSGARVHNLV